MLNFAIIGFGGLGKLHFKNVDEVAKEVGDINLVAICDVEEATFIQKSNTNLGSDSELRDLSNYHLYTDVEELLEKEKLDFVITALPTYLHEKIAVMAMEKGVHVFSEKPMAINWEQAENMLVAAQRNGVKLMIGQCLRFWPAYVALKKAIDSKKYGNVVRAEFFRQSAKVLWSWQNWMQDVEKSGGAALDIHVHDVDFINWAFGVPKSVTSFSTSSVTEHESILTRYEYENMLVTSKADWEFPTGFPFSGTYTVRFEDATMTYDGRDVVVYTDGEKTKLELSKESAYVNEIIEFVNCIREDRVSVINPPEESLRSLAIALAERESAKIGKPVAMEL